MFEHLTQAIVLNVKPHGEQDLFVDLYTKNLGRVSARVRGGRKILSKLASHFSVLNLVIVRLVQKSNFTVADVLIEDRFLALKKNNREYNRAKDLIFLMRRILPRTVPDLRFWHELVRNFRDSKIDFEIFLKILGYDPVGALCGQCSDKKVKYFFVTEQSFYCVRCGPKVSENDLIDLD